MEKLTEQQKQNINGGMGPMMLWTVITGACLAVTTLMNVISSLSSSSTEQKNGTYNAQQPTEQKKSKTSNMSLRITPRLSSSAFYLPI